MNFGSGLRRLCAEKVSMPARRSTLMLAAGWVVTFVLYLFVKPDDITPVKTTPAPAAPAVHQVPALVPPAP